MCACLRVCGGGEGGGVHVCVSIHTHALYCHPSRSQVTLEQWGKSDLLKVVQGPGVDLNSGAQDLNPLYQAVLPHMHTHTHTHTHICRRQRAMAS